MTTLAFIVPAFRRFDLTRVCLTQLRRTCEVLADQHGIKATAVVVGDDANLDVADLLGFGIVRRDNKPLGRKWNDGIEYACRYLGVDYVMPFGTDNWVLADLVAHLPSEGHIMAHRMCSLVHEHGNRMVTLNITYDGGDGIRCMPASLLECLGYRPCDEDRDRATDTSMRDRLGTKLGTRPPFEYTDLHPLQIVGFQSPEQQLNQYDDLADTFGASERTDHWGWLAEMYGPSPVADVREVFASRLVPA